MAAYSGGSGSIVDRSDAMSRPVGWWPRIVVLLGVVFTAMGAVIALVHPVMLVSPHDEINGAVHIYAGYLAARNFALAGMLLVLLIIGARRALGNLVAVVGLIQFLDAGMDVVEGRWAVVPGVFVFGLVFLFAASRYSGAAFWKIEAWK
jgi:hypothetical protein